MATQPTVTSTAPDTSGITWDTAPTQPATPPASTTDPSGITWDSQPTPASGTSVQQADTNNPLNIDPNASVATKIERGINDFGAGIGENFLDTINHLDNLTGQHGWLHQRTEAAQAELARNNAGNPGLREAGKIAETGAEFEGGSEVAKAIQGFAMAALSADGLSGLSASDRLLKVHKTIKAIEESPLLTRIITSVGRLGTVGTAQGLAHGDTVADAAKQGAVAGATGGVMEGASSLLPKIGDWAEGKANDTYARALGPSGKIDNAKTAQVAPGLVKRLGFSGSMDSLKAKAAQYLAEAGDKLGDVEDSLSPDLKVDTGVASQSLRNLADSNTLTAKGDLPVLKTIPHTSSILDEFGKPIITSTDIPDTQPTTVEDQTGHSTAVRATATKLADQIDKIDPSIQNVIKQRRILDDGLSGVYKGSDPAANGSVLAQKHAADVLRGAIATASPEMDIANKEYAFWKKTNEVLDNTIRRRTGKVGGLLNMAAVGTGAVRLASGDPTGAVEAFGLMKAAKELIYSVPALTGRASLLNRLASTVGTGDVSGTLGLLKKEAGPAVAALFSNLYEQHSGEKSPSK